MDTTNDGHSTQPTGGDGSQQTERARERACFVETTYSLPIAGTPVPLPCPWCGDNSMVSITIKESRIEEGEVRHRAHAECQGCGLELVGSITSQAAGIVSYADVVLEAARQWNWRCTPATAAPAAAEQQDGASPSGPNPLTYRLEGAVNLLEAAHRLFEYDGDGDDNAARWALEFAVSEFRAIKDDCEMAIHRGGRS